MHLTFICPQARVARCLQLKNAKLFLRKEKFLNFTIHTSIDLKKANYLINSKNFEVIQ